MAMGPASFPARTMGSFTAFPTSISLKHERKSEPCTRSSGLRRRRAGDPLRASTHSCEPFGAAQNRIAPLVCRRRSVASDRLSRTGRGFSHCRNCPIRTGAGKRTITRFSTGFMSRCVRAARSVGCVANRRVPCASAAPTGQAFTEKWRTRRVKFDPLHAILARRMLDGCCGDGFAHAN